ncbi:hypothetical protein Tco_0414927 [Tanacetum coccineum]
MYGDNCGDARHWDPSEIQAVPQVRGSSIQGAEFSALFSYFSRPAKVNSWVDNSKREIRAFSQHENKSLTDAWLQVLNDAAGGIFLYKTPNQAYQLLEDKVLLKLDWAKNQKTKSSLKKTVAFTAEGNSNSDTDKIMVRMDAMTMKMDAQYKDFESRSKQPNLDDDDIPMSRDEEAKFMQTFRSTSFYNDYRDRDSDRDNWHSRNDYNRDNYQSNSDDKPNLQKQLSDFIKDQHSTNSFVKDTFIDLKNKLKTTTKNHQASIQNLKAKFNRFADKQSGRPSGSLPSNTQPNPKCSSSKPYQPHTRIENMNAISTRREEYFDALLDEGSEILHSIEGTILEQKLFAEFDEFMAMTADENSES